MNARRMTKQDQRRQALMQLASSDYGMAPMRAVEAMEALRRMDNGTYGTCIDCNVRIAAARLDVKPESIRCVECQRLHDQYLAA